MNWNRAMVLARKNAIVKKNLAYERGGRFWDALDREFDSETQLEYLRDTLNPVADEYEANGEIDQSNELIDLIKEDSFSSEDFNHEDWGVKVAEFFEREGDFFRGLINKYERYLKINPIQHEATQLQIPFNRYLS